ncbi:bifunctional hydroxymethylpyrimidine kinase/phosphomethylpyrimidine kinase [Corynebacterium propinquum]|uniref:bifunctional hydroxymethylpyrimidine kinase/phosphomethylpyrimidine kinase n=2 Tax=Corynebacterium propinquum TaxID=43769 RepID=UPI00035EB7D4|nr:bifunctional hydroxymethylpyrimidine kinase/phosphomethylpyrimidine kinase [Corynebacterium propinquum]
MIVDRKSVYDFGLVFAANFASLEDMKTNARILSIAGTDPTGGAGVQADLKSIAAAGGFGMSVVTALVAQNTQGVRSIHTPPQNFLREQLASVADDVELDAVKIGMLGDSATVDTVSEWLRGRSNTTVVLDPVMVASSGDRLLQSEAEAKVRELCKHVDVITPNLKELAVLVEDDEATDFDAAVEQAQRFAKTHDVNVIVKGGHLDGSIADNAAVSADGSVHRVPAVRVDTKNTHGTGCSLSSALATRLGGGETLHSALEWSTHWLHEAIATADALGVGKGNGPVDHFHQLRRFAAYADTTPWTFPVNDDAPAPAIAAQGPHTSQLWEQTGTLWRQIMELPFISALTSGELSEDDFLFYLAQDALYLELYSRALARLSTIAPTADEQVWWAKAAQECLTVEAELHRSFDVPKVDPSPITAAYTDFLVARTFTDDYAVGVAAVLPCFWLYAEIGEAIAQHNHAQHPYHSWLETYSDPDFAEDARTAIRVVEQAFANASESTRKRATRAYLMASAHEREFFDQAARRQR